MHPAVAVFDPGRKVARGVVSMRLEGVKRARTRHIAGDALKPLGVVALALSHASNGAQRCPIVAQPHPFTHLLYARAHEDHQRGNHEAKISYFG